MQGVCALHFVNEFAFLNDNIRMCGCMSVCVGEMFAPLQTGLVSVCVQRQCKVQETQLKCTKARNDYLFDLEAANASMNKYYLQDLSALIDVSVLVWHGFTGTACKSREKFVIIHTNIGKTSQLVFLGSKFLILTSVDNLSRIRYLIVKTHSCTLVHNIFMLIIISTHFSYC